MPQRSRKTLDRVTFKTKKAHILLLVRERLELSRVDIAEECGLDKKTVSVAVDDLLDEGLLAPAGFKESSAGRRQELLALNGSHGNFIGIDLGGTHIIGIVTDLTARVLDRVFFEIRPGLPVDIILDQMKSICGSLAASAKATAAIRSIGICVPGFINPATGASIKAENIPGWSDIPVRAVFEKEFGRPVYTEDCSRAFGIAERWFGQGRGKKDFILLDLGYGIGMAIFAGGRLHVGSSYKSGEIGHTIVEPGGRECVCGNRGCLETVASGKAIAREAAAGIQGGKSELLLGLTQGDAGSVTAQDVAIAAGMRDPYAGELLGRAGFYVGLALGNAVNILNPSAVILGGGLVGSNKVLVESVAVSLGRHTMMGIHRDLSLQVSNLGIDGSALGASALAMSAVFDRVS
jgi:predicted NBD/HSP70 family sugar kinase